MSGVVLCIFKTHLHRTWIMSTRLRREIEQAQKYAALHCTEGNPTLSITESFDPETTPEPPPKTRQEPPPKTMQEPPPETRHEHPNCLRCWIRDYQILYMMSLFRSQSLDGQKKKILHAWRKARGHRVFCKTWQNFHDHATIWACL